MLNPMKLEQNIMLYLPNSNPNFELIQKLVIRPGNSNKKSNIDHKNNFEI